MRSPPLMLAMACLVVLATATGASAWTVTNNIGTWDATGTLTAFSWVEGSYPANPEDYGQIRATDGWATTDFTFTWSVKYTPGAEFPWYYSYYVTWPESRELSHLIIEVSSTLTTDDVADWDATNWLLDDHIAGGNANPNMPETFYGIKDETGATGTSYLFDFYCKREPVWGDFYMKDGNNADPPDGDYVEAWNLGFTSSDTDPYLLTPIWLTPTDDPDSAIHIAVPDSGTTGEPPIVPEPATWLLLISTAAAGAIARRRKND